MNQTVIVSVVVSVLLAGLFAFRQLRSQPLRTNMRLPLILGIIGLIELTSYLGKHHASTKAWVALVGSLVLAAVFGGLRALTVHLWEQDGQVWRKGNWLTGVLWIASLAGHFGIDYLVDPHNPNGGLSGSTVLLYLAVTYTLQRLIMENRARRLGLTGSRPGEPLNTGAV